MHSNKPMSNGYTDINNPGSGYCGDYAFFMATLPAIKDQILKGDLSNNKIFKDDKHQDLAGLLYGGYKRAYGKKYYASRYKSQENMLTKEAFSDKIMQFDLKNPDKKFLTLTSLSLRTILYEIHNDKIKNAASVEDQKSALFNAAYRGKVGVAAARFSTNSRYNDWYDYVNPINWVKSLGHAVFGNDFMEKIHSINKTTAKTQFSELSEDCLKRAHSQLFDDSFFSPGKKYLEEIDLRDNLADYFGINVSVIGVKSNENIAKSKGVVILHQSNIQVGLLGHFSAYIPEDDLQKSQDNMNQLAIINSSITEELSSPHDKQPEEKRHDGNDGNHGCIVGKGSGALFQDHRESDQPDQINNKFSKDWLNTALNPFVKGSGGNG